MVEREGFTQEWVSYYRQGIVLESLDTISTDSAIVGLTSMMEAAGATGSNVIRSELYPIVEKSLKNKDNQKAFKSNIDRYMAAHIESYSSLGPSTRPTLSPTDVNNFLKIVNLTDEQIKGCLKKMKGNNANWKTFNSSYNIAIVCSLRVFSIEKNEEQVKNAILYMVTNIYQFMFYKYYKYPPNEAVMAYTIANLSQRFKIKKMGTILNALVDITMTCYETHKTRLNKFDDVDVLKFVNDAFSRINSFMRKLTNEYMENIKQGNYLQSEHDDYSDEHYYEADNDSFAIDRITNKVLTNLVINGPDRKLVQLAAQNSQVSVNMLQTSVLTLVSEDHRDDIREMIECLLGLYLSKDNPNSRIEDLGSNKFYVYCIGVYRQSNTTNSNIIKIKSILDRWIVELDLKKKVSSPGSIGNYRKAIFIFFVFTIEKLC